MPKQTNPRRNGVSPRTAALLDEGRQLRSEAPRGEHAGWVALSNRRDPVEILEEQAATRIRDLVTIRYGRMSVSPFAFFRGAAGIMAADLAETPSAGLRVQSCGDAHLANFGVFAAPDRRLVFDLNDFDETLPAPFEWDLKRLAASMAVAARDNGFRRRHQRRTARAAVRAYQRVLAEFTHLGFLDAWYTRIDVNPLLEASRAKGRDVTAAAKAVARHSGARASARSHGSRRRSTAATGSSRRRR